jgi:hypothetical protein
MNNIALTVALATAPSSAFEELRARPRFWFPLLLLVASTAAIMYWYYSMVDFEWFKEVMFGNNPDIQKLPEDQRAAVLGMYTRTTMLWGSVIGTIIMLPVIYLLFGLYLLVAAKVTKLPQEFTFKHWFAFTCWTSLPTLIASVVAAVMLLISDTSQVSPGVMTSLSLNELVFNRPLNSPGQNFLSSLGIPGFLSWALMIIGVHEWSKRSWLFSTIVALLPIAVIFGVWSLFAFR